MFRNLLNSLFGGASISHRNAPRRGSVQASTSTQGPRQVNAAGATSYYEALSDSKDRTPVPAYALAIKSLLASFNRERLSFLARWLYDNDGLVAYAVDQIANYSVPIVPQAASASPEWNAKANAYFDSWAERADFTGRFDFWMLQRLICKSSDFDGDIGAVMTSENGIPQLQLIETWRIGSKKVTDPKVLHIDGVRITEKGAVTGFFIEDANKPSVPISSNEMKLVYDPDNYGSYRGLTPFRRGCNDVRDGKDIKGFEKLAAKIGSALAAVIEGGPVEENVWGDDSDSDDGGNEVEALDTPTQQEKKLNLFDLLGGDIPVIEDGKLHQLENKRPGDRVIQMLGYLGGCFVLGLGLPAAFILDEKMTGPASRGLNGKAQRKFDQKQQMIAAFVKWVWIRVISDAIDKGELESVEGFDRMEWQGPAKVSIDEGRDAQQWREDFANGLMTRQNHYANRQLNWQRETAQSLAEDRHILSELKKLATDFPEIPITALLKKYGFGDAKAQAPAPDEEQEDPENPDDPEAKKKKPNDDEQENDE